MIVNECTGQWFFQNGEFITADKFDIDLLKSDSSFYEALRISYGKALFLNDHIDRLKNSVGNDNLRGLISTYNFEDIIRKLASVNNKETGNIKILLGAKPNINLLIYFIKHKYPDAGLYKSGVKLTTFNAERKTPGVKSVNLQLRETAEDILQKKDFYEVLLINNNGVITEGHKSNIFFIKKGCVFTPPEYMVLPGITRKYTIDICKKNNIPCNEQLITTNELSKFECAFITGTSPKILPVKNIDGVYYNVNNIVMRTLMLQYDKIIEENLYEK